MNVSVVIPVHNREGPLLQAVQSVLEQSYRAFELIVVDDGSDTSMESAQALVEEAGHHWIWQEQQGVSAARNAGLAQARYEWIAFLDSDDRWKPFKLEKQVKFHLERPDILISQTDEEWYRHGRWVNKKKHQRLTEGDAFNDCLEHCCISPSSVLMHQSVFSECGGAFDEGLPVCEDYELWLRVAARYEVGLIRERLIEKFGGHDDQLSRSMPAMDRFRLYAILKLLAFTELSDTQQHLAQESGLCRTAVLSLGARKHAPEHVATYEKITEALLCRNFRQAFTFVTTIIP